MLVQCGIHVVSYIVIRGSVPVYWTQPGYKYRPLPIIERGTCLCRCICLFNVQEIERGGDRERE